MVFATLGAKLHMSYTIIEGYYGRDKNKMVAVRLSIGCNFPMEGKGSQLHKQRCGSICRAYCGTGRTMIFPIYFAVLLPK